MDSVYAGEGKIAIDYSVVTRMPRSKTGEALIAIAGITQSGTRAASDYITDPERIKLHETGPTRTCSSYSRPS